jgi:hypothetical protein
MGAYFDGQYHVRGPDGWSPKMPFQDAAKLVPKTELQAARERFDKAIARCAYVGGGIRKLTVDGFYNDRANAIRILRSDGLTALEATAVCRRVCRR